MDDNNQSTDDNQGEEGFAELLEKSFKKQGRLDPGQMVEAMIVKITSEWIFLDLGGKGEGYLDRKEMLDAEGNLSVKEGDRVRAFFLSAENNEMHFTTKIGSGPAGHTQLEDAWGDGMGQDREHSRRPLGWRGGGGDRQETVLEKGTVLLQPERRAA